MNKAQVTLIIKALEKAKQGPSFLEDAALFASPEAHEAVQYRYKMWADGWIVSALEAAVKGVK